MEDGLIVPIAITPIIKASLAITTEALIPDGQRRLSQSGPLLLERLAKASSRLTKGSVSSSSPQLKSAPPAKGRAGLS